jgi:signal peptidase I
MNTIVYGPGKKRITQLLRQSSKHRAAAVFGAMTACVALAIVVRLFALESVQVDDGSMRPEIRPESRTWICKLPVCIDHSPFSAPLLAKTRSGDPVLRWKLGEPGDTIRFSPAGRVFLKKHYWTWRHEPTIIDDQTLYVPRRGDTLRLDSLSPMGFDFATKLFHKQWPSRQTWVIPTLWNGDQPLLMAEVGRTTIGNRPVAPNEANGLPWQELRLLEMQLQRIEASPSPVRFKRRFYADSTEIKKFVVREDCWYLACSRGGLCMDSREEGYFTRADILGTTLPIPSLSRVSPMSEKKKPTR